VQTTRHPDALSKRKVTFSKRKARENDKKNTLGKISICLEVSTSRGQKEILSENVCVQRAPFDPDPHIWPPTWTAAHGHGENIHGYIVARCDTDLSLYLSFSLPTSTCTACGATQPTTWQKWNLLLEIQEVGERCVLACACVHL
jgi:hypothetical protein